MAADLPSFVPVRYGDQNKCILKTKHPAFLDLKVQGGQIVVQL